MKVNWEKRKITSIVNCERCGDQKSIDVKFEQSARAALYQKWDNGISYRLVFDADKRMIICESCHIEVLRIKQLQKQHRDEFMKGDPVEIGIYLTDSGQDDKGD